MWFIVWGLVLRFIGWRIRRFGFGIRKGGRKERRPGMRGEGKNKMKEEALLYGGIQWRFFSVCYLTEALRCLRIVLV